MNVLALCAGLGGLELGLRLAGIPTRTVCIVEGGAFPAACLAPEIGEESLAAPPIWGDLCTFDARLWRGVVDCITAGFPCQPASVAGSRRGQDDERWLWPEVARVIRESEPSLVFLENVQGLLSVGNGGAFEEVLGGLAELGFDAEWGVLSAQAVGAPHIRRRVFVLAADSERFKVRDKQQWKSRRRSGEICNEGASEPRDDGCQGDVSYAGGSRLEGQADNSCRQWEGPCVGIDPDSNSGRRKAGPKPLDPEFRGPRGDIAHGLGEGLEQGTYWERTAAPEPCLRILDDGHPWSHELHALGNAVVPDQAAEAFRQLARRLLDG